jgi:hypothetical protein
MRQWKTPKGQIIEDADELLVNMQDFIKEIGRETWDSAPLLAWDWQQEYRWWFRRRSMDQDLIRIFSTFIKITVPRTKLRDRLTFVAVLVHALPEERREAVLASPKLRRVQEVAL